MILPLGGLVLGAVLGAFGAKRRGGKPADLAQWAAVWAMILGVLGLILMIVLDRTLQ
jgi:hypothetical protein